MAILVLRFTSTVLNALHKGLSFPHSDTSGRLPCKAEFEAGFIDPSVIWQPILPAEQQPSRMCVYTIFVLYRYARHNNIIATRIVSKWAPALWIKYFFHLMIQTKHLSCIGCTRTFNALFRVQSTIHFPFSLLKHSRCKTLLFPSHCYMRIETHIFCVDKHLTGRNRVYMITWAIFLSLSSYHSEFCIVASVQTVKIGVFIP